MKQGFQKILTPLSHRTDKYLFKVKSRKTMLIFRLWLKSVIKTKGQSHAVFIF